MMKFSNYNIPVSQDNNPKIEPVKSETRRTSTKFACRDPYILAYGGKYYFYQSAGTPGVKCSVSDDLEHWSEPVMVYTIIKNGQKATESTSIKIGKHRGAKTQVWTTVTPHSANICHLYSPIVAQPL